MCDTSSYCMVSQYKNIILDWDNHTFLLEIIVKTGKCINFAEKFKPSDFKKKNNKQKGINHYEHKGHLLGRRLLLGNGTLF